jgi:hypothetical protein
MRFSASQYHDGMSNLVFSVKLSLGGAISAAGKYKSKFKAFELENNFQVDVEGISDEQILHSAVGILAGRYALYFSSNCVIRKTFL